jgi:hypothetical protein
MYAYCFTFSSTFYTCKGAVKKGVRIERTFFSPGHCYSSRFPPVQTNPGGYKVSVAEYFTTRPERDHRGDARRVHGRLHATLQGHPASRPPARSTQAAVKGESVGRTRRPGPASPDHGGAGAPVTVRAQVRTAAGLIGDRLRRIQGPGIHQRINAMHGWSSPPGPGTYRTPAISVGSPPQQQRQKTKQYVLTTAVKQPAATGGGMNREKLM